MAAALTGDSDINRNALELGTCSSHENDREKCIATYANLFHS